MAPKHFGMQVESQETFNDGSADWAEFAEWESEQSHREFEDDLAMADANRLLQQLYNSQPRKPLTRELVAARIPF